LFFDEENPAEQRHGNILRQVMEQGIAKGGLLIDRKKRQWDRFGFLLLQIDFLIGEKVLFKVFQF